MCELHRMEIEQNENTAQQLAVQGKDYDMQKFMQKFTSAFLAANMIFSIVATNFVAYAEEAPNALSVSEEILADDAVFSL